MKKTWNLGLLYKSHDDPQIEKDLKAVESIFSKFEKTYRGKTDYLKNEAKLLAALTDFEKLFATLPLTRPLFYFQFTQDLDASDSVARTKIPQIMHRMTVNEHKLTFFELSLAKIPAPLQKKFLASKKLLPYRYFLSTTFNRAKHNLTESEEKIMGLMSIPAYQQWISLTDKILNKQTVEFRGEKLPISAATQMIHELPLKERRGLHEKSMTVLASISDIAESEINAVVTDKKICDSIRKYKEPYDSTILGYQNDRKSVLALVNTVTDNFKISHRFYNLKAKLLNLPQLEYSDRAVGIGTAEKKVSFDESVEILRKVFGSADKRYLDILNSYLENGQIDVYPKVGKTGGAYCSPNRNDKTFVLLNHTESFDQVMTFAHEMGHAIHTDLSKSQPALYQDYSTSTAEVASTFFESLVFDAVLETLSPEEKVIAIHKRLNDDMQTIFRQISFFNFETELHNTIRKNGGMSKEDICSLMNKHMSAYLGPITKMNDIDGNFYVMIGHIRRYFYVYSYAFGQLISRALYSEYKKDKKFIEKVNKFLMAGGSMSPESIFKSIGIDVTKPDFWLKGLKSIEKDIEALENLTKVKSK